MSTVQLNRTQRRHLQKLADRVDRVTQADRLFFERFPHRRHRVRLASKVEIEQQELLEGVSIWSPPPCRIFAVVRNIAPGVRFHLMVRGVEGAETDLSEKIAAAIFEDSATPQIWKIEADMRKAAEMRS
jgi:hypothetical protein